MKMHRMLCFGRTDESGNAAVVVEESALAKPERLEFAGRQSANATVFMEANAAGDIQLDYYYPHARSPLCLHATLAAGAVFFERSPGTRRARFVTSMHRQVLEVERVDGGIFVGVTAQRCPPLVVDVAEAAQLLRVGRAELRGVPRLASVGSAKLLVAVSAPSVVATLEPDLAGIADWSRKHGVSGMYVYCRIGDGVYQGRNFNHLERQFEDAATGVAAGALAVSLKRDITVLQGDALGQPCTIQVRYAHEALQVGGRAVRVVHSRSRVCPSG